LRIIKYALSLNFYNFIKFTAVIWQYDFFHFVHIMPFCPYLLV